MLERARQSAPEDLPVDFALADATVYPFDPASFDVLASRFGVMFFADPALSFCEYAESAAALGPAGFRLLARAARKSVLHGAAAGRLQARAKAAAAGPEDPGPFAFASEARVRRILDPAGFTAIQMEPCPLPLDAAIGRGLDGAVQAAFEIGPVKPRPGRPSAGRSARRRSQFNP